MKTILILSRSSSPFVLKNQEDIVRNNHIHTNFACFVLPRCPDNVAAAIETLLISVLVEHFFLCFLSASFSYFFCQIGMAKFVSTYQKPLPHISLPDWYAKQWMLRRSADIGRVEACQLRNSGKSVRSEGDVTTKWNTYINNARLVDRCDANYLTSLA